MKKHPSIKMHCLGLILILLGLLIILYPLTSILYHDLKASRKLEHFRQEQKKIPLKELQKIKQAAQEYNQKLDGSANGVVDPFDVQGYSPQPALNYGLEEIFGYISIPKIDEKLPIYLGASQYHLSLGVAQIEGTSIPIGGEGTRAVLAGHRGFTTQNFFLHLDKLEIGDYIYLYTENEELEYCVYSKETILPTAYEKLEIHQGEDLLTLLTCEPYLISTHRLIINAKRRQQVQPTPHEVDKVIAKEKKRGDQVSSLDPTVKATKNLLIATLSFLWLLFFFFLFRLLRISCKKQ